MSRHARRGGQAAAGVVSLLTLAGLVAGLPAGLYAAAGSPVPRTAPSWHQAAAIADEAARAGAGQVNRSAAYAHGGTFTTDPAAARVYLAASGHTGAITITGDRTITATVTVTEPAVFIIGISRLSSTQSASANLVQGVTGPQP